MDDTEKVVKEIALTIPITFVVAALVTYAYSYIAHGAGVVDWGTALFLAILMGIVVPVSRVMNGRKTRTHQE